MSRVTSPAAGQPDLIDQVPEHGPTLRGWATALGLGGLIPFVALAAGAAVLDVDSARRAVGAQIQCAGSVLSFIGALHWGVALSLYAWLVTVAPAWQPDSDAARTTLALLIAGFVAVWLVDRALYRRHPVRAWFMQLRTVFTAGATLALLAALLAVVVRR